MVLLAGRDIPLATLTAGVENVVAGQGDVILIGGGPGMGKSTLLDAAIEGADPRVGVLRARGEELEQRRPLGPLRTSLGLLRRAADRRRREIAELLTAAGPSGTTPLQLGQIPDGQTRAIEAVVDLVQDIADTPTMLVIDDVHWADPATLIALRQLGRRTRYASLLLVLTFRPDGPRPEVDQLIESLSEEGATRLALDPLGAADTNLLIEAAFGAPPGASLSVALEGAGGSPLFVHELIRSLRDEALVQVMDGRAEMTTAELPSSFRTTVARRIEQLPEPQARVVRAAALLGGDFSPADLTVLVDMPLPTLIDVLHDLMRAELIEESGARLALRHDLLRRAIHEATPLAIRRAQHRELATRLRESGTEPERLAWHLSESADPPNEEVADCLRQAAAAHATSAPAIAVDLLERAIEYLPADHPDTASLRGELAAALIWSGRSHDGAELAGRTITHGSTSTRLRSVLALAFVMEGRFSEAIAEIDALLDATEIDADVEAELRAEGALCGFLCGDLVRAEHQARRALDDGRRLGNHLAICVSLCALAWTATARGELEAALTHATEAVTEGETASDRALARYSPHLFLGVVLAALDRLHDAATVLRTARHVAETAGTLNHVPAHHACLALVLVDLGRWDDAYAELEAGLAAADELGVSTGVVWLNGIRAYLDAMRDDGPAAAAALERAEQVLMTSGPQVGVDWVMRARAASQPGTADDSALAILGNAWDLYEALGITTHRSTVGCDLLYLAIETGDDTRAASVASVFTAATGIAPAPRSIALAQQANGLIGRNPGQLLDAATAFATAGRRFEAARARSMAAVFLAEMGRAGDARSEFDAAAEIYTELRAIRPQARMGAAERRVGIVRGRRGPRRRPDTGWQSLTPTESDVVRLVAEGLSNRLIGERLFISRRTVETHVSHVFAKLGVRSRTEIATLAAVR